MRARTEQAGTIVREVLTRSERSKLDQENDRDFYVYPRLVQHVDDGFRTQLTQLYRELIPEGSAVLDLCSSWVSHLPPEKEYKRVVGHGLNAQELAKNPQLTDFFVRNLNTDPDGWALEDSSMDAVVCCVSVQYMQQPERVFAEVYRVLKPGGVVIVSFSNRLFYNKAIEAWRDNTGFGRVQLVKQYFGAVAGFTAPEVFTEVDTSAAPRGPLGGLVYKLWKLLKLSSGNPFYAVVAYRNFKPVHED